MPEYGDLYGRSRYSRRRETYPRRNPPLSPLRLDEDDDSPVVPPSVHLSTYYISTRAACMRGETENKKR